ncbi:MAG: CaiB/BaiF CoA transferase family protein, partial [Paracoccaceae bacterium]
VKGVMMQAAQPFAGRLVLDISQGIAGPYCGRLMAEHGARVIKIEPPAGDWIRKIGGGPSGQSVNFLYYNLGKESVVLDLKTPEAVATALRIAAQADVVIESGRPGVMDRLGLGFEHIRAIAPKVVYTSVSGFGQEGPRGHDPMTDTVAQAYSGMMSINHGLDGIPHKIETTIIDAITGLYAFQQTSMALMAGGPARHVDVSLLQAAAAVMGPKVMEFAHFGHTPATPNPPAGSYQTKDGWIAITLVRDSQFGDISRALGQPEWAEDRRFLTFPDRLENLAVLVELMNQQTRTRTTAEWMPVFEAHNVLASPIQNFGDWLAEPQVQATQGAPEVTVADGITSPAPRTPGRVAFGSPAPAQGADTDRILAEFSKD